VFKAICAGFNVTPSVCIDENDPRSGKMRPRTIIMIIALVIVVNLVIIYCYRRYAKKEMREEMQLQISSIMSQYLALSETSNKVPSAAPR